MQTKLIQLDEDTHIYTDRKGNIISSVTQIIESIFPFKYGNDYVSQRGKAVHTACDLIDTGELDWDTVDKRIEGYAWAYQKFLSEVKPIYVASEQIVYSEVYGYCGTLDRHTSRILYDIKTGVKVFTHAYQTAGYVEAVGLRLKRKCLYLKDNGNYKVVAYTDGSDIFNFLACLKIFNIKKKEGLI